MSLRTLDINSVIDVFSREQYDIYIFDAPTGVGKTRFIPPGAISSGFRRVVVTFPRIFLAQESRRFFYETYGDNIPSVTLTSVDKPTKDELNNANIIFATEGSVLNSDKVLYNMDILIMDEIHEMTINSLLLLDRYKRSNESYKLVLMSATLNQNMFVDYFDKKVVYYERFASRAILKTSHLCLVRKEQEDVCEDSFDYKILEYDSSVEDLLESIDGIKQEDGTLRKPVILIGVPGKRDAENLRKNINQRNLGYNVYTLYRNTEKTPAEVARISASSNNTIIIATNIVMSGITFPYLDIVIPPSQSNYMVDGKLIPADISVDERTQWSGRVGRTKPGFVFYNKSVANIINKEIAPSIVTNFNPGEYMYILQHGSSPSNLIIKPTFTKIVEVAEILQKLQFITPDEHLTALGAEYVRHSSTIFDFESSCLLTFSDPEYYHAVKAITFGIKNMPNSDTKASISMYETTSSDHVNYLQYILSGEDDILYSQLLEYFDGDENTIEIVKQQIRRKDCYRAILRAMNLSKYYVFKNKTNFAGIKIDSKIKDKVYASYIPVTRGQYHIAPLKTLLN